MKTLQEFLIAMRQFERGGLFEKNLKKLKDENQQQMWLNFEKLFHAAESRTMPMSVKSYMGSVMNSETKLKKRLVANKLLGVLGLGMVFDDRERLNEKLDELYNSAFGGRIIELHYERIVEKIKHWESVEIPDLTEKQYEEFFGKKNMPFHSFFNALKEYKFFNPSGTSKKGLDFLKEIADFRAWEDSKNKVFGNVDMKFKPGKDFEQAKKMTEIMSGTFERNPMGSVCDPLSDTVYNLLLHFGKSIEECVPEEVPCFRLRKHEVVNDETVEINTIVYLEGLTYENLAELLPAIDNTIELRAKTYAKRPDGEYYRVKLAVHKEFESWETALFANYDPRVNPSDYLLFGFNTVEQIKPVKFYEILALKNLFNEHNEAVYEEFMKHIGADMSLFSQYAKWARRKCAWSWFFLLRNFDEFEKMMKLPPEERPADEIATFVWYSYRDASFESKMRMTKQLKEFNPHLLEELATKVDSSIRKLKEKQVQLDESMESFKKKTGTKPKFVSSQSYDLFAQYMKSVETNSVYPSPIMFVNNNFPTSDQKKKLFPKLKYLETLLEDDAIKINGFSYYNDIDCVKKDIAYLKRKGIDKKAYLECLINIDHGWWQEFSDLVSTYGDRDKFFEVAKTRTGSLREFKKKVEFLLSGLFSGENAFPESLMNELIDKKIPFAVFKRFMDGNSPNNYFAEIRTQSKESNQKRKRFLWKEFAEDFMGFIEFAKKDIEW